MSPGLASGEGEGERVVLQKVPRIVKCSVYKH